MQAAVQAELQPQQQGVVLLSLPPELLSDIARALLPTAPSSVHPPSYVTTLSPTASTVSISLISTPQLVRPLLSLALTCRTFNEVATPFIYASPQLNRLRQARLLAYTLATSKRGERLAQCIRHLYLPCDGFLTASDALADQQAWPTSLQVIFAATPKLRCIHLGTAVAPTAAALKSFLSVTTVARPKRVCIQSVALRDATFTDMDLTPLSEVTHLHLSYCSPPMPSELITFFSGRNGVSAAPPLRQLRLSRLPAATFQSFEATVESRNEYETFPSAGLPITGIPSRVVAAQFALYDLAQASKHMPELERVTLELNGLQALNEPEWASAAAAAVAAQGAGFGTAASVPFDQFTSTPGQLATLDWPDNVPVSAVEAEQWTAQHSFLAHAGAASKPSTADEAAQRLRVELERDRTAVRDAYWMEVRDGRELLAELFAKARAEAKLGAVEIRIVAPRPGGWDPGEQRADFHAQAAASSHSSSSTGTEKAAPASAAHAYSHDEALYPNALTLPSALLATSLDAGDATSFSDPDVFTLAQTRPFLGYAASSSSRRGSANSSPGIGVGPGEKEARPQVPVKQLWWTGVLPRVNAMGSR